MAIKKAAFIFLLCLFLPAGCAPAPEPTPSPAVTPAAVPSPPSLAQDEVPAWTSCRIVDGAGEGELLLAELDYELNPREDSRHDGKSVYRLSLNGTRCEETVQPDGTILAAAVANGGVSIYLDGEPAQPSDLMDGMPVEVSLPNWGRRTSSTPTASVLLNAPAEGTLTCAASICRC